MPMTNSKSRTALYEVPVCAATGLEKLARPVRRKAELNGQRSIPPEPVLTAALLATSADVRDVVRLLRRYPEGVSVMDAGDAFRKRVFDPLKVAAYEHWGFVTRADTRLTLTALGWELARKLKPEAWLFGGVLHRLAPYRAALAWAYDEQRECVTETEVLRYWQQPGADALRLVGEPIAKPNALAFFHLCQAADLGTVTLGKRGQPARLRFDLAELACFNTTDKNAPPPHALERIFISCARPSRVAEQVRLALELAGLSGEIVEREANTTGWLPEPTCHRLRHCAAAVILLTADDLAQSEFPAALLIEIGAARAFYAERLFVLFEQGVSLPPELASLPHGSFAQQQLSWETGAQLVRRLKTH
jgi:hypothetical protein